MKTAQEWLDSLLYQAPFWPGEHWKSDLRELIRDAQRDALESAAKLFEGESSMMRAVRADIRRLKP